MKLIRVSLVETAPVRCSACGTKMVDSIQRRVSSYIDTPQHITEFLEAELDGDVKYLLETIEMTEEEFEALPEFEGF